MMKVKYYTCPVCKQKYNSLSGWASHMEKIHPNECPEGYSMSRFFYKVKTGKTSGKCRMCGGATEWNESSMKYLIFCSNPKCKEEYVKIAKSRMRNVYGKEYILDDPNVQKKMMANRRISGKYTFSDGGKIEYVGSYERNFLMMLDTLLDWPSNDIIGPSPHVYYYEYSNKQYDSHEGRKFYIPDYFIPSLNLEIEIKQQTSTHERFNQINKVKEKLKDAIMSKNKKVNYLKINDNDFREFFQYLEDAKKEDPSEVEKVTEAYIDEDCINIEDREEVNTTKEITISPSCECINGCNLLTEGYSCNDCEYSIAQEAISKPREIEQIENYYKSHNIKSGIAKSGKWGLKAYTSGKSNSLFLLSNPNCNSIAKDLKKVVGKNFVITVDNYNSIFLKRKKTIATEEANYTDTNKYPVFIVLQHYNSFFSSGISFTGDEFSHACISFNSNLAPLYSFGIKELATRLPQIGFVIHEEGPDHVFFKLNKAVYSVFVMYVSKEVIEAMKSRLYEFIATKDTWKYDFRNLISVWRQIPSEKSKKWFCSRFVAEIIGAGRKLDKYASLHKPQDFTSYHDITLVNNGIDFKRYKVSITERNLTKVKQHKFDEIKPANESKMTISKDALGTLFYPSEYTLTSLKYEVSDGTIKNGVVRVEGIENILRYRSEMMIIRDGNIFINIRNKHDGMNLKYTFPGGGINPQEDPRDTAMREAQEEVRINVANVKYVGSYIRTFPEKAMINSWEKHKVGVNYRYTGSYSTVFIGTYFSDYDGEIKKEDKSDMIKTGKFLPIAEVYDMLDPIHKEAIDKYLNGGFENITPVSLETFTNVDVKEDLLPACEGIIANFFNKRDKSENSHDSWARKLFMSNSRNIFGQPKMKRGIHMTIKDGKFEFYGLSTRMLYNRIKQFYEDRSIYELFIPVYNAFDYRKFKKKKLGRSQMRIDYMKVDQFFAIELVCLFKDLGDRFKDNHYKHLAKVIYSESWLAEADKKAEETPLLPTENLKNLDLTLNDYQKDFIEKYPKLKAQLHLKGYILAFEQGLGKTLTAISLAECLNTDHVYIVCPNSLKANWALEIKKYYKKYNKDEDLWRQEVFICSDSPTLFSEHTAKYIITNNESIEKMYPYVLKGKNILILDESHNFRNINSKRVGQLIDLRDKLQCTDSLIMSGTPIKATPDEIVPALMMIDPTFSIEAAQTFTRAFKLRSALGTSLVQTRFSKIMFRKEKDVLGDTLPEKIIHNLPMKIKDSDKYIMANVSDVVMKRFSELYEEGYPNIKKLEPEFFEMSKRYIPAGYSLMEFRRIMNIIVNKDGDVHELDKEYAENYMSKARANISDKTTRDRYDYLIRKYARFCAHCLGVAFGEVLPPYRRDMFISLYKDNRSTIINMIKDNVKKTLIFTQFKGVATYIHADLNEHGVKSGLITGDVSDRLSVLQDFKENPKTEVLVATSQTIGTGVTLTEANQMFFFGPPWRDGDFQQCSDRIHRIGQTDTCNIYTVTLDTGEVLNLSTRMDKILAWSKQMTDAVIKPTEDTDNIEETHFEELLKASESALLPEFFTTPEKNKIDLLKRLKNESFNSIVTEQSTLYYRIYRAKKSIPENMVIMESNTSLEARELLENAKYISPVIPNVEFKELKRGNESYIGLVTTRKINVGEMIRLPRIE